MGRKARERRKKKMFNAATYNVRGLADHGKRETLAVDIENYEIDVCCLQETKVVEAVDIELENGCRFININSDNRHYGCGFIISKKWKNSIYEYWKISDRIAVLQLRTSKSNHREPNKNNTCEIDHVITLINVYAPTSERSKEYPNETLGFYKKLQEIVKKLKKLTSSVIINRRTFQW